MTGLSQTVPHTRGPDCLKRKGVPLARPSRLCLLSSLRLHQLVVAAANFLLAMPAAGVAATSTASA